MTELIIENSTSLFEPIKVSVDGKDFFVRSLDRKGMKTLSAYDDKLRKNPELTYERLEFVLDKKPGTFDDWPIEIVNEVSGFIIMQIYSRKRKKVMNPGNKDSKK